MGIHFDITVKNIDDIAIVYPAGYIDFEAKDIMIPFFSELMENKIKRILINFQNVKKINSMGLSVILEIIDDLKEQHAKIRYSNLSRQNEKLFELIGLTEFGEMYSSEIEALANFV